MLKLCKSILCFLALTFGLTAFGQTNKETAEKKCIDAIELMDEGHYDESIKLLKEAQKLDPEKFDYPYELAYAHYLMKDYKGAIKILEKIEDHKDVSDRLYQLLGNSYDIIGKSDKAIKVYDAGLKKFPNSGIIYLEKGNVYWIKKEYDKALPLYEKGIELDPKFPSNYYRAAKLFLSSKEEMWGLIYGEIFMNLERNTNRTKEISRLMYETYKSEIEFTSDTSMTVSFCQQMTITINDLSDIKNMKLPFCMVYEPTLLMSIIGVKKIDINSLDDIRKNFVVNYFKGGNDKTYPNVLFDYQDKVLKAGHMEAYNHWILMKGDPDAFDLWKSNNGRKYDNFVKWFTDNGLELDNSHKFYRKQY
jgi:tetratricopeptide (TPR) repeat protein